jgi:small-conductance mechanosensitive channel
MNLILVVVGRSVSPLLVAASGLEAASFSPRRIRRAILVFAGILVVFLATSPTGLAQVPLPASQPAPQVDISQLTAEERADLLSRLSDEQVRELMLAYMAGQAGLETKQTPAIDEVHQAITLFRERFGARLSHVGELSSVPGFVYVKLAEEKGPYHPLLVLGLFIGITLLAFAVERGYRRGARRLYEGLALPKDAQPLQRLGRLLARLCLDLLGVAVFAAAILGMFFLLYQGHEPTRLAVMTLLTAMLIVRISSVFSLFFFAPFASNLRIAPFDDEVAVRIHRWIVAATTIAAFGILACGLMLRLGLSPVLHELLLDMVSLVLVLTLMVGALRLRKPVAAALLPQIEGEGHPHRLLRSLASLWHVAFIVYILLFYFLSAYKRVTGEQTAAYPGLLSLLIVVSIPGADFFLRSLLDRFLPAEKRDGQRRNASALDVFKRAARILLVILALFLLGKVWGVDFFALGQDSFGEELMRAIVDIALTLLVAYVAWGGIKAALARYLPPEGEEQAHGADEGGGASASRLATILPLVMRFIQITLAVIVVMILLSSLGVDIGPLLAGAGVVGLAVGFGTQTLVRDVVSGLFFLMDDAFRKGEYVDIGSVKGTVESINVRSLVLRHHLGILHTVPYGEIQHLSNFSRDWVIVKMEFRVPTDTDVNQVKKIFKQIGADMLEHPELGADFLEPFKSQGVKAIEDSAIIVRGKFMSKPGRQFMLRKELYNRVQKAFQDSGIEFAHRKVTVELPPHLKLSGDEEAQLAEAAGAAAIAAEEAEKETKDQATKA